ncbi:hypothetical protein NDU88_003812 [Pleurodeles waltl]|uniref:Uncharacterized protein n=1 Tax=Pleurodeles waltl TaxID=8319 RepID=A0AAV7KZI9_PLEWA|nr:hypothetical protein NDU88_003812 [Pleurodeles waltl]
MHHGPHRLHIQDPLACSQDTLGTIGSTPAQTTPTVYLRGRSDPMGPWAQLTMAGASTMHQSSSQAKIVCPTNLSQNLTKSTCCGKRQTGAAYEITAVPTVHSHCQKGSGAQDTAGLFAGLSVSVSSTSCQPSFEAMPL